jgi:hypothetical protein
MYFRRTQPAMSLLAAWHQMCLHMNLHINQKAFNGIFSA